MLQSVGEVMLNVLGCQLWLIRKRSGLDVQLVTKLLHS